MSFGVTLLVRPRCRPPSSWSFASYRANHTHGLSLDVLRELVRSDDARTRIHAVWALGLRATSLFPHLRDEPDTGVRRPITPSSTARWNMPRVELLARDGTRWRHAFGWGASPRSYGDAPAGFRAAYRALLSLKPATTSTFQPAEVIVKYTPEPLAAGSVPWPSDVPQPSADGSSQSFDPRYDAQLQQLVAVSREQHRPIAFADKTWRVELARMYRGERVVMAVRQCAQHGL